MTTDAFPRCNFCGKVLAEFATRPWTIKCRRCSTENYMPDTDDPRPTDGHRKDEVPHAQRGISDLAPHPVATSPRP